MKNKLLSAITIMAIVITQLSFVSVFAATPSSATATQTPIESAFTDAKFLSAVRTAIGKTNDEHIYPSDVESVTELNIERKKITNLAGIEYFTGLKELYAAANKLVSVDFSRNEQLEKIDCSYNTSLLELNVSNNLKLKTLECNYGKLSKLDVSNNPELTRLICFSNKLRTLDVSKNPLLEELNAKGMGLALMDMRNNPKLNKVNITQNYISEDRVLLPEGITMESGIIVYSPQKTSDLSGTFTDQKFLECVRDSINKPTGSIYPSDVNQITELDVEGKELTSLNGIEHLQSLETLNCASNYLTDLDISSNLELKDVKCYRNDITSLDFANNKELQDINAYNNKLEDVNISENAQLANVDVSYNELSSIDISGSDKLNEVNISKNNIASDDAIILSDKYLSNLMEQARTTGYKTVPTNDARIKIFPQYGRYVYMNVLGQNNMDLNVEIYSVEQATFKVFDITDYSGTEKYEDKDMPYEREFDDDEFEKKIENLKAGATEQTINVNAKTGENEEGEYEGIVTLKGNKDYYKLLVVSYVENEPGNPSAGIHADAAQVREVTIVPVHRDPKVVEFKINNGCTRHSNSLGNYEYGLNGKGDVFDILATRKPRVIFYGEEFYVYIALENYENVQNVIIRMSRNDHNSIIENQYIKLTSVGNGIFTGKGKIPHGSELSDTWGREGKMYVYQTQKDDVNKEEVLIDSYDARLIMDPSGYIYEGVPSNRLRDVKTSLYYKDRNGEAVKWNASEEDQKNPIFTDSRGTFEWAVPAGKWQIKAEKEGYGTYYTDWLPVPPAQMDVNFSMMSTEKPKVTQISAYPDGVEIQFNKYMHSEDMSLENINITLQGINIVEDIIPMDKEQDYWESERDGTIISGGTGNYYTSRIKVKPSVTLMKGDSIGVSINKNVRTYAGVTMTENYDSNSVVEKKPTGMSVYEDNTGSDKPPMGIGDEAYSLTCGTTQNIKVQITPVDSSIGKKLYLVMDNDWAVSLPSEVIIDDEGWATIPVEAVLPLDVKISMYLEGCGLAKEIQMSVVSE